MIKERSREEKTVRKGEEVRGGNVKKRKAEGMMGGKMGKDEKKRKKLLLFPFNQLLDEFLSSASFSTSLHTSELFGSSVVNTHTQSYLIQQLLMSLPALLSRSLAGGGSWLQT